MMATPSFASALKDVQEVVLPLVSPPASTFTVPLLDKFAASNDPLMESDMLFTAKADLGSVHVELDATSRTLARNAAAEIDRSTIEFGAKDPASDSRQLLEAAKQARLRSRLRSIAGDSRPSGGRDGETGPNRTRSTVSREAKLRKEAFDREIAQEEAEVLEDFKRKLRESVLQTSNAN